MSARPGGLATPRTPKEGHEAEFVAVLAASMAAVERIDEDCKSDELLDILTSPRRPGLFSPSLISVLRQRAQAMIDTIWLLRRLNAIADGPPGSTYQFTTNVPNTEESGLQKEMQQWWCKGLTPAELVVVEDAMRTAAYRLNHVREANRRKPDHCPECGGAATDCEADGSPRRLRAAGPAPYRICGECAEITANPGALAIAGLRLVRR